jgi:hypothetical protein
LSIYPFVASLCLSCLCLSLCFLSVCWSVCLSVCLNSFFVDLSVFVFLLFF